MPQRPCIPPCNAPCTRAPAALACQENLPEASSSSSQPEEEGLSRHPWSIANRWSGSEPAGHAQRGCR
jgi:hypothetical protein